MRSSSPSSVTDAHSSKFPLQFPLRLNGFAPAQWLKLVRGRGNLAEQAVDDEAEWLGRRWSSWQLLRRTDGQLTSVGPFLLRDELYVNTFPEQIIRRPEPELDPGQIRSAEPFR